jgi:hypothetical protein
MVAAAYLPNVNHGGERSLFTELGSLGIKELESYPSTGRYPSTQENPVSDNGSFGIMGSGKDG